MKNRIFSVLWLVGLSGFKLCAIYIEILKFEHKVKLKGYEHF